MVVIPWVAAIPDGTPWRDVNHMPLAELGPRLVEVVKKIAKPRRFLYYR
jgi:hypothetical protein